MDSLNLLKIAPQNVISPKLNILEEKDFQLRISSELETKICQKNHKDEEIAWKPVALKTNLDGNLSIDLLNKHGNQVIANCTIPFQDIKPDSEPLYSGSLQTDGIDIGYIFLIICFGSDHAKQAISINEEQKINIQDMVSKEELDQELMEIAQPYIAYVLQARVEEIANNENEKAQKKFQEIYEQFFREMIQTGGDKRLGIVANRNLFTKEQAKYLKRYFTLTVESTAFLRHNETTQIKHPEMHSVNSDLLEVFMLRLLYNLGFCLNPVFHSYKDQGISPFVLFDDAPKLKGQYFYAYVSAVEPNFEMVKTHQDYNKGALLMNLIVDFWGLLWVSSSPRTFGFRVLRPGGCETTLINALAALTSEKEQHQKKQMQEKIENILKEDNTFVRGFLENDTNETKSLDNFEIHRVRKEKNCHVFILEPSSNLPSLKKEKIQKAYYSQSIQDYLIIPLLLTFGINRSLIQSESDIQSRVNALVEKYENSKKTFKHLKNLEFTSDKNTLVAAVKELDEGRLLISQTPDETFSGEHRSLGFEAAIQDTMQFMQGINEEYSILQENQYEEMKRLANYYIENWRVLKMKVRSLC